MRSKAMFATALVASILVAGAAAPAVPAYVLAAVANPARPDVDRKRDTDRKPADVIAFSRMRPGWKVADYIPGTGYYDRIFARVVGPAGRIYAFYPAEIPNFRKEVTLPADGTSPFLGAANITAVVRPANAFASPVPLDLVWISDNYHDLHDPFFAPADVAQINKAVFKALRPGGIYLVVDHVAQPGSGLRDTNTLHRIDKTAVIAEVEAAGFKLTGESDALHDPADDHTKNIFNPAVRGHTDQFILRFRKP